MAIRTFNQIEKDIKKIRKASKTATNIIEVAQITGLSYSTITKTLACHPSISKIVMDNIASNQAKEAENCAQTVIMSDSTNLNRNNELIQCTNIVLDASACEVSRIVSVIISEISYGNKIILTSVTINELEKMQHFHDNAAKNARSILKVAAKDDVNFIPVFIDETVGNPDDCIIKYCKENYKHVHLITADKSMALKARMYDVKVTFFDSESILDPNKNHTSSYFSYNSDFFIRPLYPVRKIGNKFVISRFVTPTQYICIYSNGIEYNYKYAGTKELEIGDDVFIATKKLDYISFSHYHVVSLGNECNCEFRFYKRFYNSNISEIRNVYYSTFIKDAISYLTFDS